MRHEIQIASRFIGEVAQKDHETSFAEKWYLVWDFVSLS